MLFCSRCSVENRQTLWDGAGAKNWAGICMTKPPWFQAFPTSAVLLVPKSGVIFTLNFITGFRFWAPRFSFVCIGEVLSVYLSVWDAPDKTLQGDSVNTDLLALLTENTLDVVCQNSAGKMRGGGKCHRSWINFQSQWERRELNRQNVEHQIARTRQCSSMTCEGIQMGNRHPNRPFGGKNSKE